MVRELVGVVVVWGTHRVGQLESLSCLAATLSTLLSISPHLSWNFKLFMHGCVYTGLCLFTSLMDFDCGLSHDAWVLFD